MKKIYFTLFAIFQILKVATLGLAALYLLFWFYRFFNFPFANSLAMIFDFFIQPITANFPTTQVQGEHIAEYGYFVMGLILCVVVFVFARLEDLMVALDRRYDIKDIVKKQILQEKVNEELHREMVADIMGYKYFSVFVKFKINFINEIIATTNAINLADAKQRGYNNFITLVKQWLPNLSVVKKGDSAFISGLWPNDFDDIITYILEAIKTVKIQNNKDAIKTDFLIIFDCQTDKKTSEGSYLKLSSMSNMEYYNKALVTSAFKARFDLIQNTSKFMTDILGFSVLDDNKKDDSEIFILKSKPDKIN